MRITADLRFAIIPEWLLDHPDITPIALRVFAVLARYADKDTDLAKRSRQTIADRARCSLTHLDRTLSLLRQVGALSWEHQHDSRGLAPSAYLLHFLPRGALPPQVGVGTTTGEAPSSIVLSREVDTSEQVSTAACQREGCTKPAGHPGAHQDPWWDNIAQAVYPGEAIPRHHEALAGRLAARARQAGHPPERILEAAAWIVDKWGAEKLTLASLAEHYERASGQLAQNTEQVKRRLTALVRRRAEPPPHRHDWEPSFAGLGIEHCAACGTTRHVSEHRSTEV